jgi:hypothetical protein
MPDALLAIEIGNRQASKVFLGAHQIMATIQRPATDHTSKLSWYLSHAQHGIWDRFSPSEQQKMVDEDLFAGQSVSLLLTSVITVGLLMAAASLVIVLLAG